MTENSQIGQECYSWHVLWDHKLESMDTGAVKSAYRYLYLAFGRCVLVGCSKCCPSVFLREGEATGICGFTPDMKDNDYKKDPTGSPIIRKGIHNWPDSDSDHSIYVWIHNNCAIEKLQNIKSKELKSNIKAFIRVTVSDEKGIFEAPRVMQFDTRTVLVFALASPLKVVDKDLLTQVPDLLDRILGHDIEESSHDVNTLITLLKHEDWLYNSEVAKLLNVFHDDPVLLFFLWVLIKKGKYDTCKTLLGNDGLQFTAREAGTDVEKIEKQLEIEHAGPIPRDLSVKWAKSKHDTDKDVPKEEKEIALKNWFKEYSEMATSCGIEPDWWSEAENVATRCSDHDLI